MTSAGRPLAIPPMMLRAELHLPPEARALVIFAQERQSDRSSTRDPAAEALGRVGIATLRLDLLTEDEAEQHTDLFDIDLLCCRLLDAIDWARDEPRLAKLPIGLFGADAGAAAALKVAATRPDQVRAVVTRGGRPDLAAAALGRASSPTLLIIGERDAPALAAAQAPAQRLGGPARSEIVPGAAQLLEEPGGPDQVIDHARAWFSQHLLPAPARA